MSTSIAFDSEVLNTRLYSQFKIDSDNTTGLTFAVDAGQRGGSSTVDIAADSVTLVDNSVNFVYIDVSNTLAVAAALPTDTASTLYRVTASGGAITLIEDLRTLALR